MSIAVDSIRPESVECERVGAEIKILQTKVRSFDNELRAIKQIFSGNIYLDDARLKRLKIRRRKLGELREKHQEMIRVLKAQLKSQGGS